MEHTDTSYAPRSPDLTGYYPSEPEPAPQYHQQYRGSISHTLTPYTPGEGSTQAQYLPPSQHSMPRRGTKHEVDAEEEWTPEGSSPTENYKRMKIEEGEDVEASGEGVEVKTKFPVARIKRIMQADDDVGKVAQVTPVVVSKALELFMISLVTKAATEAKSRSSKRVGAAHLKQAIMKDEQFDFLQGIVSKVQDAPTKSEPQADDAEVPEKKRRGGGRRKRKDSEDE